MKHRTHIALLGGIKAAIRNGADFTGNNRIMNPALIEIAKPAPKDFRSPLAKARDAYLESPEGIANCDPTSLGAYAAQRQFLRNRIELAYLAGAKDALTIQAEKALEKWGGEK